MDRKLRYLGVVAAVLLLAIPAVIYLRGMEEAPEYEKEPPSQAWVKRLEASKTNSIGFSENKVLLVYSSGRDYPLVAAAAVPVAIHRDGGDMVYNPLIVHDSDDDALDRYLSLTDRDRADLDAGNARAATIAMAEANWLSSDFIIVFSDYKNASAVAPLAAYYNIPMVYATTAAEVKPLVKKLGCHYAISVGEAPALSIPTMGISWNSEVDTNEFYTWCLKASGTTPDYIVVTNPDDIHNTWGVQGYLPIPGISTNAPALAAYHRALLLFTEGYNRSEVGISPIDPMTMNQMGARVDVANAYANHTRSLIGNASAFISSQGGKLRYLAFVGDPIGVPYYYRFFKPDSSDSTSFSNTNFVASDYYFSNLDEDEHQDIAYGRIVGRSLTDASLLCVRSMGYDEYRDYSFEKGGVAEGVYNTLSGDWKKNAGVFVGTTKPLPMPGALKHMKKYQYDVLRSGGYFVTGEEALRLNDITAAQVLDQMNYLMYCGHGDYDCWYSNRADNIDAGFVATQKLKPGFAAVMACLTGRIDNTSIPMDETVSMAFLHAGLNGYIGSSRLAYGLFQIGDGDQGLLLDTGALYLVDRISAHLVEGGHSIGELLMLARNEVIDRYGTDENDSNGFEACVTMWEYMCYADPAWTPVNS